MEPEARIAHRYATLPAALIKGRLYRSVTLGVLQLDYGMGGVDTFTAYAADAQGNELWADVPRRHREKAWRVVERLARTVAPPAKGRGVDEGERRRA